MPISLLVASMLVGLAVPGAGVEPGSRLALEETDPEAIVGGVEATTCQWPAVVAMLEDDPTPVMCSGSLVHPRVVLTAAHCIIPERPIVAVSFGEHGLPGGIPQRVVSITECVGNPSYYSDGGADVGYCRLEESVDDVPIVPLLAGCETQAVGPAGEVVIVGFGATWGSYDENGDLQTMGVGTKRYTTQLVDFVDPGFQEINLYGTTGSQSACFGDSGGPALVRLDDGTWRVLGTGSHLYDPGGLPPPADPDNYCGAGAAYGYVPFGLDWLEQASGHDLTPCWDGDVWAPGPDCEAFPMEPDLEGSWNTSCAGGAVGGGEPPACAEPPSGSGSSDGSDDDTWGVPLDDLGGGGWTTSGDPPGATSGAPNPPPEPPPWGTDTGALGSSDDASLDEGTLVERGCACATSPRARFAPLWVLVLGAVARSRARVQSIQRSQRGSRVMSPPFSRLYTFHSPSPCSMRNDSTGPNTASSSAGVHVGR